MKLSFRPNQAGAGSIRTMAIGMAVGRRCAGLVCVSQLGDSRITQQQQGLNQVALRSAVLAIDHLQDLARTNEVVACSGIGFVGGALGSGICVVV